MLTFILRALCNPWIAALLFILAFGIVGHMDYTDARMEECARKRLDYNSSTDRCVKPN